jgi:hypothetical protein
MEMHQRAVLSVAKEPELFFLIRHSMKGKLIPMGTVKCRFTKKPCRAEVVTSIELRGKKTYTLNAISMQKLVGDLPAQISSTDVDLIVRTLEARQKVEESW